VDKLFSVSQNGADYLKQKYPQFAFKIHTSYLGTEDNGNNKLQTESLFTIVSCAKIRNIKRIFLIPEILKKLDFPVKWIHLGDENLSANDPTKDRYIQNKKSLEKFDKIEVLCKGNLSNEEIFKFYKETPVHLFLSVSETEGLPVSIMEAISFGIPVMATDVGGCREIVNETTGILIPKDFSNDKAAELIKNFKNSSLNGMENRKKIRNFWLNHFEVNTNYRLFFNQLEGK
jgi:glycosyltransferase involved in cell wall biosynthesis